VEIYQIIFSLLSGQQETRKLPGDLIKSATELPDFMMPDDIENLRLTHTSQLPFSISSSNGI
jgi:hypothetical protein